MKSVVTFIFLALLAIPALATSPLFDSLAYEGGTQAVWEAPRGGWLWFPTNDKTQTIARNERCSAIGAPRGRWKIEDEKIYLVRFFKCGGEIPLEHVYGGDGAPIFADWLSGSIATHRGTLLCLDAFTGLYQKTITFKIDKGIVVGISEQDNTNHPALFSMSDAKEMFARQGKKPSVKELEGAVASGRYFCQTRRKAHD